MNLTADETPTAQPLLTREQVARRLGTTARHVRTLACSGALPHFRIGGKVRFSGADVESFISASRA